MSMNITPSPATIRVGEASNPVLDFQLLDAFGAAQDITGDAFQLTVWITNIRYPDNTVSRTTWELAGTVVTAAEGKFRFTLTHAHTGLAPGSYYGELLWWASGTTTEPPRERMAITFIVEQRIDNP